MKGKKFWAAANAIVTVAIIFWNYYANTGVIEGKNVGEISGQYSSLFTPAGYTFTIWGIIYLGLIYQTFYFLKSVFKTETNTDFIIKAAPWLILANISNGLWLWFWLNEQIGMSVLLLFAITFFLMIAVFQLNMERSNLPLHYKVGVWWPLGIYVGWVSVASIANVSIYLKDIGWNVGLSEISWTIIMIIIAFSLNLFMILSRNMREFAVVGIWALMGISAQHWNEIPTIQWTAIVCSMLLLIAIIFHIIKNRAKLRHVQNPKEKTHTNI
jgi:hypothetical protein